MATVTLRAHVVEAPHRYSDPQQLLIRVDGVWECVNVCRDGRDVCLAIVNQTKAMQRGVKKPCPGIEPEDHTLCNIRQAESDLKAVCFHVCV
jgi:hypothetical protein